jgi:hypothetical protein
MLLRWLGYGELWAKGAGFWRTFARMGTCANPHASPNPSRAVLYPLYAAVITPSSRRSHHTIMVVLTPQAKEGIAAARRRKPQRRMPGPGKKLPGTTLATGAITHAQSLTSNIVAALKRATTMGDDQDKPDDDLEAGMSTSTRSFSRSSGPVVAATAVASGSGAGGGPALNDGDRAAQEAVRPSTASSQEAETRGDDVPHVLSEESSVAMQQWEEGMLSALQRERIERARSALDRAKRAHALHAGEKVMGPAPADTADPAPVLPELSTGKSRAMAEEVDDALTQTPLDRRTSIDDGAGARQSARL